MARLEAAVNGPIDNARLLWRCWRQRTKPSVPAANTPRVPGQDPGAGQDAGPPVLMRPQPAPGQDCGPVHAGIGFNREGCMFTWEPGWGYWEHKQHRLPFNVAEWEARPSDGR